MTMLSFMWLGILVGHTCPSIYSLVLVQTVSSCYKDVHNKYWKEKLLICSFRTKHTVITVLSVVVFVCQVPSQYHSLLNVNKRSLPISCKCCTIMSKVFDRLVNAILKNVEMSWFSSTGCSANIPLIVHII